MNEEKSRAPVLDKRKGNSGRKKSADPAIQCSLYIPESQIKLLGGKQKAMAFMRKAIKKEADARFLEKLKKDLGQVTPLSPGHK